MKRIFVSLLALCVCLGTIACGGDRQDIPGDIAGLASEAAEAIDAIRGTQTPDVPDVPDDPGNDDYSGKESYRVIAAFAKAVSDQDFETAFSLIDLPANSVVTVDDLKYHLTRSDFADMFGAGAEINSFEDRRTSASAELKAGQTRINIYAVFTDDDEWLIDLPALYMKDKTVMAPGKTSVSINGVLLDQAAAEKYTSDETGRGIYTVTLPNRAVMVKTTDCFGEHEFELEQSSISGVDFTACRSLDSEEVIDVTAKTKETLNAFMSLVESGETAVSAYESLFAPGTAASEINDAVSYVKSVLGGKKNSNHRLTEFAVREDARTFMVTDTRIVINAKYRHDWHYSSLSSEDYSTLYGWIYVERAEDGSCLISKPGVCLSHIFCDLFTNQFQRDW